MDEIGVTELFSCVSVFSQQTVRIHWRLVCISLQVSPTPSQESLVSQHSGQSGEDPGSLDPNDDGSAPFMPKPFCVYTGHSADMLDISWSKVSFHLFRATLLSRITWEDRSLKVQIDFIYKWFQSCISELLFANVVDGQNGAAVAHKPEGVSLYIPAHGFRHSYRFPSKGKIVCFGFLIKIWPLDSPRSKCGEVQARGLVWVLDISQFKSQKNLIWAVMPIFITVKYC